MPERTPDNAKCFRRLAPCVGRFLVGRSSRVGDGGGNRVAGLGGRRRSRRLAGRERGDGDNGHEQQSEITHAFLRGLDELPKRYRNCRPSNAISINGRFARVSGRCGRACRTHPARHSRSEVERLNAGRPMPPIPPPIMPIPHACRVAPRHCLHALKRVAVGQTHVCPLARRHADLGGPYASSRLFLRAAD